MKLGYLARNQWGRDVHLTGTEDPRQQLLRILGGQHIKKMCVDRTDGTARHVGYVIGQDCWTIYEVHEWTGEYA